MERISVVLVSADLLARSRLEAAASAAGADLKTLSLKGLEAALGDGTLAADLLVLDLDAGRSGVIELIAGDAAPGARVGQIVGYFSHVDDDLAAAARSAGVEAVPRGRFWRTLPELLANVSPRP